MAADAMCTSHRDVSVQGGPVADQCVACYRRAEEIKAQAEVARQKAEYAERVRRASELIALCHPLPIERVGIEVTIDAEAGEVRITGEVETIARTGVEMEALTAVSVAALNVYDMVKGIDRDVVVEGIRLLEKTKGTP